MRLLALALLLSVIIDVEYSGPTVCPQPPRTLTRQADGSYSESASWWMSPAVSCHTTIRWQEEWTDHPERGGTFIRRVDLEPM